MRKFLKNAGRWFKSAWGWADGKKTLAGTLLRFGLMATNAFAPGVLTADQYSLLLMGADILAGGGAVDKIRKEFLKKKVVN